MQREEQTSMREASPAPQKLAATADCEFDARMRRLFGDDYRKDGEGRRWWPKGRGV